jgi:hypothetical protein
MFQIICDKCGKGFNFSSTPTWPKMPFYPSIIRALATKDGWKSRFQGYEDLCPECVKEVKYIIKF